MFTANCAKKETAGKIAKLLKVIPRNGLHVYGTCAFVVLYSITPQDVFMRSDYWKIMSYKIVQRVGMPVLFGDGSN